MSTQSEIIDHLRYLRIIGRRSQNATARTLGYSKSLVHYWERQGRNIHLQHVIDYASLFDLELRLCPKSTGGKDKINGSDNTDQ
jgi:hypothetical protein